MKKLKVFLAEKGEERFMEADRFCKWRYWEARILDWGRNFKGSPDKYILVVQRREIVGTLAIEEKKVPAEIANFNSLNKKGVEIERYSFNLQEGNGKKRIITKLLFDEMAKYFGNKANNYFLFMITYSGVIAVFTRASGIKNIFIDTGVEVTSMPNRSMGFLEKRRVKFYFLNTKMLRKY